MSAELIDLGVVAAGQAIRRREVTAADLCRAYLARIAETESSTNAYVTVDAEGALLAAERADRELAAGTDRGALHGLPVGVKDLIDTAGLRTAYGSVRYRDHVPDRDAVVVRRLREAGAVILGKHATHEFAWGGRTDSPAFGPTRNPGNPDRVPGGSSGGGGASVVERSCLVAIGSDTAGSVRIPAALCGCVGLKPTIGWMSTEGVHPLAPSLDHVGLLARSVEDARTTFVALGGSAGPDLAFDPGPVKIGVLGGDHVMSDSSRAAVTGAVRLLESAGASGEVVNEGDVGRRVAAALTVVRAEAERIHRHAFEQWPETFGPDLAELMMLGPVDPSSEQQARRDLAVAVDLLHQTLEGFDLVIGATVPVPAPLIGEMSQLWGGAQVPIEFILTRSTSIADAAGVPAVTIPVVTGSLPVGVQLMAALGREHLLLDLAAWLEQAMGQRPAPSHL